MSQVTRYCQRCGCSTPHDKHSVDFMRSRESGAMRAFWAVTLIGVSELLRETRVKCLRCGSWRVE